MDTKLVFSLKKKFEECAHQEGGVEYWYARDLQRLLEYEQWRNFVNIIEKARISAKKTNRDDTDHFVEVSKMIRLGKGAEREIEDFMLTRFACYLIAQNGDSRKEQIAFAQSYFAAQTRKQELIEKRIVLIERISARKKLTSSETELSKTLYERGVDDAGFARIRSRGDQVLFGGFRTAAMKKRLKVPTKRPLADFLPTITITAKNLATEITNFNVKKDNLKGEPKITSEHMRNNKEVRNLLAKRGIKPENLPPEKDIRVLESEIKKEDKKSFGSKKGFLR